MSLLFYMDENVHGAITIGLRLRDIDVVTVQEDGRSSFPHPVILDRATELNRIVFSQDQDFLIEGNRRQQEGIYFNGIVYAHQLFISIGDCVRDIEIIATLGRPEEFINRVQFLPL
jgi:Domain of unknown function (DUF5615)